MFKHLPLVYLLLLCFLISCKPHISELDGNRPQRQLKEYFDERFLLYKLPDNYYGQTELGHSFNESKSPIIKGFRPLGHYTGLNLQYSHVYSKDCVYHTSDTIWKYAEVCFPNTCLTARDALARITVLNASPQQKIYFARLFYQNTTYWYPTDDNIDFEGRHYLDNYYGASEIVHVEVSAGDTSVINIPYTIGMNSKHGFDYDPAKDPARPGNYEFLVLILPDTTTELMSGQLDLQKVNPFAEIKKDELSNGGKKYFNHTAYVSPHHFKFVFLDEYFDGVNDLTPNHIYLPKDGKEKRLCDTCTGWFRAVISENWTADDFFQGFISKSSFVKADYGIRKENMRIDTDGVKLSIPASTKGKYQKTWGEFLFGPSFKYGHLTVRAKFAQMFNNSVTPNGIVHNLWLYQRDPEPVDTSNPYHTLTNSSGVQPYEIDFEIWSSTPLNPSSIWNDKAFVNYSIVDYMRDPNVKLKPGEQKRFGTYEAERINHRQASIIGEEFNRSYLDSFHTYELFWYPDFVRFVVDGQEKALITKEMAKIPNQYMFLWIGSPFYQDGTYFTQSYIPFLKSGKESIIDYIRIE